MVVTHVYCVLYYESLWPQIILQRTMQTMCLVMAYRTHEGKKGQMEAGIRVGTDKSVLSFSHLIR